VGVSSYLICLSEDIGLGLTREYGVYVYPGTGSADGINGDHIIIAPAYNITEDDVDEIAKRVIKLITDFFNDEAALGN
jgi:adenosylmethionine-8-amino-7-oxononanoate aminotransferase